jgi:archaellum biogenesis protein FlaJ (TadC family)
MSKDINKRMNDMYQRDCWLAWFDVVLLWATVLFVLFAILGIVEDSNIRLAMYISCAALLLFNTASVFAMTKHLKEDKDFIYGLDIQHLDANLAAKQQNRSLS